MIDVNRRKNLVSFSFILFKCEDVQNNYNYNTPLCWLLTKPKDYVSRKKSQRTGVGF
jgi:hypothetical protein